MVSGNTTTQLDESGGECIPFLCPVCGQKLKVDANVDAFEVACPGCSSLIMTPAVGIGPGTRLDDFILKRRIGRGAMGDVYEAEQCSLSRTVAVKILAPAWGSNPEMSARFQREVKTLARLEHPNIVTAFTAGRSRGVHYLAMHYVKGGNLQDIIKDRGYMSEVEALSVVYKVADALSYAWKEQGLIHRDIKPANIMIEPDGEIKLTDLGISKCIYEDESMTHGHRVFGTPFYMSPEQARGVLHLDFRSDQYSLGATLYHLLAGRPPFESKDVNEVIRQHGNATPQSIREIRPDLSRGCVECLTRMMARQPEDRYGSWAALIHDVGATLVDHTTREIALVEDPRDVPRQSGKPAGPQRPHGRRQAIIWAAVALAALLITGLWNLSRERWDDKTSLVREEMQEAGDVIKEQVSKAQDVVTTYVEKRKDEKETRERVMQVMESLDREAALFIVRGKVDEAIALYRNYEGPMATESKPERRKRVAELMIPD